MKNKIIILAIAFWVGVLHTASVKSEKLKSKVIKKSNHVSQVKKTRYHNYRPRLSLPVDRKKFWVSSYFGPRKNPNGLGFHSGVDLAAFRGTPVKAAGDGLVVYAGWRRGYGNLVEIAHSKHLRTRYAHLDKISTRVGKRVRSGALVGKVGATGNVRSSRKGGDPSHLHFEVRDHGKAMNPLYFLKKI